MNSTFRVQGIDHIVVNVADVERSGSGDGRTKKI